jgi:MYXO-CTERM domain-containing protein
MVDMDQDGTGSGRWSARANRAARDAAQRVDDTSGETSRRAAGAIVAAVRLLRWPTAAVSWLPIPFIVGTVLIGLAGDGAGGWVVTIVGLAMAAVAGAFAWRRRRVLRAVEDPEALAAELRVMVNLTGRTQDAGHVLHDIAGGGGWRVLGRLRGLWRGANLPARWIDDVGDLPRARYFAPPKIGTTVTLAVAALWLVPVSVVVLVLAAVGAVAGSI